MASLADLQAERERLKAANAKAEFDAALAETCAGADLMAAGNAVRRLLLDALDAAASYFVSAIAGEREETRVHYLISEAAHQWATALGEKAAAATPMLPEVGDRFRRGVKPRDLITVSQWADRHRELRSGTNAPGPWHNALTPYLVEIMDALSEHSSVRQVTFMKSSGVGGTEAMFNWIGYLMHHLGNKDLLCVMPTLELRDRSLNPRLAKMIDESPALAGLVSTAKRARANRGDLLEYGARSRIIKAGANSPDSLRSDHLPYVICDEVDAFPWDVGGEGDPMTLIENRQRTYTRAKTYLVSTPTKEGASRITQQYARSDMRRYHVPCPHCGEYQPLEFGGKDAPYGLKFRRAPKEEGQEGPEQVAAAWYVCRECAAIIEENSKTEMLARGRWIAARPHIRHHRGYHINALYAPVGLGLSWVKVAQKWIDAQGDSSELKAFFNTYLGEVFKEEGDSIENVSLISRLEIYPEPLPVCLRTGGVDVQKDRLELTVVDWGKGEEGWVRDHVILPGDTAQPQVWEDLAETLADVEVKVCAIDSGYNASQVYAFVARRRWCFATKGVFGMGRPLVEDEKKRRQRLRVKRKRGVPVEPIGVDGGKGMLYARLKQMEPGPGYLHFPQEPAFDDEYFAQLAAEKLVTRFKGHRPIQEWVQTRARNEALDCLILALVALRLSGATLKDATVAVDAEKDQKAEPSTPLPPPTRGNDLLERIRSRARR
jgi:phage terminase large subunit GpA-like protein